MISQFAVHFRALVLLIFLFMSGGCKQSNSIQSCEEDFQLGGLSQTPISLLEYRVTEGVQIWKCRIDDSGYDDFVSFLNSQGFSNWEAGGVSYGDVDLGWYPGGDTRYCLVQRGGRSYIVAVSQRGGFCYFFKTQR